MPTYKGNAGHLMQHWTLCELLVTANKHAASLNYIDAHAMAPLATERQDKKDVHFDDVKKCRPSCGKSAYELAWHQLAPREVEGYPNSAAFVEQVWKGDFSMLLCEKNGRTCAEIEDWRQCVDKRRKATKLFCGKWQERFKDGLPSPADVGLADGSLTLIAFDPNMYDRHKVATPRPENIYPECLEVVVGAVKNLRSDILIQMSTYSANNANPQEAVILSTNQILATKGFRLLAVVRLNGNMMSMVYGCNLSWAADQADLANLGGRFDKWLSAFWKRRRVKPLRLDWTKL